MNRGLPCTNHRSLLPVPRFNLTCLRCITDFREKPAAMDPFGPSAPSQNPFLRDLPLWPKRDCYVGPK